MGNSLTAKEVLRWALAVPLAAAAYVAAFLFAQAFMVMTGGTETLGHAMGVMVAAVCAAVAGATLAPPRHRVWGGRVCLGLAALGSWGGNWLDFSGLAFAALLLWKLSTAKGSDGRII
jgi:hypothetical protein